MILLLPILVPALAGLIVLALPDKFRWWKEKIAIGATLFDLLLALALFNSNISFIVPWCGPVIDLALRLYNFSALIFIAIAGLAFLVTLYSTLFMSGKPDLNQFYGYFLLTVAFACGVVLADNLVLLLFFWEGLLITLFGLIYIGGPNSYKTALKAFIIIGITDLCLLLGIALTGQLAGTLTMSAISLSLRGLGGLAFVLMLIGALAKSGSLPFHSWIPDAALDAPLPFMAFIPGALEKLLGIYFLSRISLDLFQLDGGSWASWLLMTIGAVTIILAVLMALVQKDYKKLLSYHAISQVGYMVLGIGTMVPAGIIGGLFHMINNALYKSCLFLTGGAVEKQAGTTDIARLGGLRWQMPVTFGCFLVAALAISGVPPFNGFFSKELVYDGALERNIIFYLVAVLGSFFTAASFLKLGHAVYLGPAGDEKKAVKEADWPILTPMVVIAAVCVIFGLFNVLPIKYLIQPILGEHRLEGQDFYGWPANIWLMIMTCLVLLGALANHLYGVKKSGKGAGAVDHIHYAPLLHPAYDLAEKKVFDPYEWGLKFAALCARFLYKCDRAVDWVYDSLIVNVTAFCCRLICAWHNGNVSRYVVWALVGAALMLFYVVRA